MMKLVSVCAWLKNRVVGQTSRRMKWRRTVGERARRLVSFSTRGNDKTLFNSCSCLDHVRCQKSHRPYISDEVILLGIILIMSWSDATELFLKCLMFQYSRYPTSFKTITHHSRHSSSNGFAHVCVFMLVLAKYAVNKTLKKYNNTSANEPTQKCTFSGCISNIWCGSSRV